MNQDIFELAVYSYHIFRENSFEYLQHPYRKLSENFLAAFALEIEHEAALVAVEVHEVTALTVDDGIVRA